MVTGRDKPHSPWVPIVLGLAAAAALVASSPLPVVTAAEIPFAATVVDGSAPPPWWTSAEHPTVAADAGWLGDLPVELLPVGERGVRGELAASILVLAIAAAAGLLAFRLYRGTGRHAAAGVAVPLTAALLVAWLQARGEAIASASTALSFTLLAVLALAAVVGARVRGRGVGRATWLRVVVAGGAAVAVEPTAGILFAAALALYAAWHRRAVGVARAVWWREAMVLALVAVPALALWGWSVGHVPTDMSCSTCSGGQPLNAWVALSRLTGPALLDPAVALLVLLAVLLRWRGGGLLLVTTAVAIAGRCVPVALVLVAVAACGWIWLAGGLRRRWLAWSAVTTASAGVLALGWLAAGPRVDAPIAARRPEHALLAVVQRGLVAPGDVLLAHDPWLADAFAAAQRDEGVRPDVRLYAAASLDRDGLGEQIAGWQREGRRVLSDSFSFAGRWQAAWVLDSGPLFWLVGTVDLGGREFTDLHGYTPDLGDETVSAAERTRWERLLLERVRHRRALGRHDAAALALPRTADIQSEVAQRVHLAELSRLPAIEGSELTPAPWSAAAAPANSLAEAGDLLLALGDGETGAGYLERAAAHGVAGAFGALARWYLRAGEEEAARATLAVMADASLRPQLLDVCRWLLARARADRSAALLRALAYAPGHAPEELATRLAVLRGLASPR